MATGREQCHLVTWSPLGASIFAVSADTSYQHAMIDALATAVSAAQARRPLTPGESAQAALVRNWSYTLALDAQLLATVEARRCVRLLEEDSG